jgi:hypothetical protein
LNRQYVLLANGREVGGCGGVGAGGEAGDGTGKLGDGPDRDG